MEEPDHESSEEGEQRGPPEDIDEGPKERLLLKLAVNVADRSGAGLRRTDPVSEASAQQLCSFRS